MTRVSGFSLVLVAATALSGCISVRVDAGGGAPNVRSSGLVDGYLTASALRKFDGVILSVGVLGSNTRPGEIVSADIWPLAGVGLGLVGCRARLMPFEAGVGVLGYCPRPVVDTASPCRCPTHAGKPCQPGGAAAPASHRH